jgi:hypothetical protein
MKKYIPIVILLLFLTCLIPTSVNATPTFLNPSPANGAVNISFIGTLKYVPLSVNVSGGNLKHISIETNATGSWVELTSIDFAVAIPYQIITTKIYNCTYATKYYWRVNAHDNTTTNLTSQIYYFTTKSQQQQNGSGGGGGGETPIGSINIFPTTPTSGKLFAIFLDKPIDTNGYIWIQNTMYPIVISKGFGTVQVDESIYGNAILWLYPGTQKTFTIACGLSGSLTITVPSTVQVNKPTDITIKVSGKSVSLATLIITDPLGIDTSVNTTNGVVNYVFNKVGTWLVRTTFAGQNDVQNVNVIYQTMGVGTDQSSYLAGDDVTITADPNALVSIELGGVIKIQSLATNGNVIFTPKDPGSYTATATLGNKQGSVDFSVSQQVRIKVFDVATNAEVIQAKANTMYMVKVIDSRDQALGNYQFVTVISSNPDQIEPEIPLNGGIGFWTPKDGGVMTLHVDEIAGYVTQDLSINVEGSTNYVIPIIVVIIVIIVMILLILFRSRIPKSITDKLKLKPKREIPI